MIKVKPFLVCGPKTDTQSHETIIPKELQINPFSAKFLCDVNLSPVLTWRPWICFWLLSFFVSQGFLFNIKKIPQ